MPDPILQLSSVRHRYADAADWALDLDALGLWPGEVLGILGPNGSGKSTLLRIAAGAIRPESGRVLVDGRELGSVDRRWIARRLGYLPQSVDSQFDFRVEQVVAMGRFAHLHGLGMLDGEDDRAVAWALDATDTERLRTRRLSHLSGGERQRVFLASVLAQEPRALLLDEPTRYLDIHHQVRFFRLLVELAAGGMAVAVVTHDVSLAALHCARIVLLDAGRPVIEGPADEVLASDAIDRVYQGEVVRAVHPQSGRTILVPADGAGHRQRADPAPRV